MPASTPGGIQTTTVNVANAVSDPVPANDSASDSTTVVETATPPPGGGLPPTSTASPPLVLPDLDLTVAVVLGLLAVAGVVLGRARDRSR